MQCPKCGSTLTKVLDSRCIDIGIRRRRTCHHCQYRFTTVEAAGVDPASIAKLLREVRSARSALDRLIIQGSATAIGSDEDE